MSRLPRTALGALLGVALVASLVAPSPAPAAAVSKLFEAEVPVSDQSSEARRAALAQALREVLVKVTGRRELAHGEVAAELVEEPSRYVQRYRYRDRPVETTPEGGPSLALSVSFDRDAIRRRLRELGLPVWGETRPPVLVWLALQRSDERHIVAADSPQPERAFIRDPARARGLPVLTPLMDVEDRRDVRFSDIWGGFLEDVRKASTRYDPHILLVGRIDASGAAAVGRWWLVQRDEVQTWEVRAAELSQAVAAGVHGAADRLAARYAVADAGGGAQSLAVTVSEVSDVDGYLRVSDYLAELSPVSSVSTLRVTPDRVVFRLRVRGGAQALDRALTLGDTLASVGGPPDRGVDGALDVQRAYRLLP